MFNVSEQPWTLLGAAVIVLFIVLTVRAVLPERRQWWQWLFPIGVAALAFGLDYLFTTDLEQVHSLIKTVLKAVEQEDSQTIDRCISIQYQDSRHASKEQLMRHCREELDGPAVVKCKKKGARVEISPPKGRATLSLFVLFEKETRVAQTYKPNVLLKVGLYLTKESDHTWRIIRIELLEVDLQPVNWRSV